MKTTTDKDIKERGRSLKNKVSDKLLQALDADFEVHGQAAVERLRVENPAAYVKIAADQVPKEQNIVVTGSQFADCQSTAEVAEAMLLASGATSVTAKMRDTAVKEIARHAAAIDAIAKPQQGPPESEIDRQARLAHRERSASLRRATPICATTD